MANAYDEKGVLNASQPNMVAPPRVIGVQHTIITVPQFALAAKAGFTGVYCPLITGVGNVIMNVKAAVSSPITPAIDFLVGPAYIDTSGEVQLYTDGAAGTSRVRSLKVGGTQHDFDGSPVFGINLSDAVINKADSYYWLGYPGFIVIFDDNSSAAITGTFDFEFILS